MEFATADVLKLFGCDRNLPVAFARFNSAVGLVRSVALEGAQWMRKM